MRLSPYALALARAAEMAGGIDALAVELRYSSALLRACITGYQKTPTVIFLKVVDYLMNPDRTLVGNSRAAKTPAMPMEQSRR